MQKQIPKITPWALFVGLGLAVFSVLVLTTIVPIAHWIPMSVTETAKVIAVTEKGCVVESSYGYPVIVSGCAAKPGEEIVVSYNVPAIFESQYMKRVESRASYVVP